MVKSSFQNLILKSFSLLSILPLLIFSIVVLTIIYDGKISSFQNNQHQTLNQVKQFSNHMLDETEYIANSVKMSLNNNLPLYNVISTHKTIKNFLILNNNGIIEKVYSRKGEKDFEFFDFSNKEYFKKIKEGKEFYWSNIFLSNFDNEPQISYSFNIDNNKVGVLFLSLELLGEFTKTLVDSNKKSTISFFDKNGILIFDNDFKKEASQQYNAMFTPIYKDLINVKKNDEIGYFKSDLSSSYNIGIHSHIDKTFWTIVIHAEVMDLFKEIIDISFGMLFFVIVLIMFSYLLSMKLSYKILKPLNELEANAQEIVNENYNFSIMPSKYKEFNSLIKGFNQMRNKISSRENKLKSSIKSFKDLSNSTLESLFLLEDNICLEVNDIAKDILGYKNKEDLLGKDFLSFVHKSSKELFLEKFKKDFIPCELKLVKENNIIIETLVQGKFIKYNDRDICVIAVVDITDLKNKDQIMFQQSKMAAMGEMIGNITHQWRQPLSVISTASSGIKIKHELNMLTDDSLVETMDNINDSVQYLSTTINDFRNFFNPNKEKTYFNLEQVFKRTYNLISSKFKNLEIEFIEEFEDVRVYAYENEFIQVLINILNNAQDELEKLSDEKYIFVRIYSEDGNAVINIMDNANGISQDIVNKVFDPYFTTKADADGTGIGLYMSKEIIEKHMQGSISVENKTFEYKNKTYSGASFTIKIPYA